MNDDEADLARNSARLLSERLNSAGWGLFFIWIGVALFGQLSWGVGLLGVGAIVLGVEILRKIGGLRVSGFWLTVGILFFASGAWELLKVRFGAAAAPDGLVPLLCIVVGAVLFLSALRSKPRPRSPAAGRRTF